MIALVVICWAIATMAFGFLMFRYGYNTGWQERHLSMILPRNVVDSLNRRLDDEELHNRHSAIDPKKAVWH